MARAKASPSPPPSTDAADAAHPNAQLTSIATTAITTTIVDATAADDSAASRAADAPSSAITTSSTATNELQPRVWTPRVLRKPRMTLAEVDALLAGEDPASVLPQPPSLPAAGRPPLAKSQVVAPARKAPVKKRRGRDVPGVEWDESLFHFANCVRIELSELNAEFVANNEISFAAFKQLWKLRRMSAAFHVEFWESSPSTTHQTILQMALDLLVCCVEEQSPFEDQHAVAALFGFVFALYSAYSVQLGTPKHKIDVDPRSWTALLAIEGAAATGLGSLLFPQASREVVAMLGALGQRENAFLKCLRGFGHQFRLKSGRLAAAKASERRHVGHGGLAVSDLQTLLKQEQVEQLDALSRQYSDSVALISAKSSNGGAVALAAASLSKPRAGKLAPKHAPVVELSQTHEKSRAELLTRLQSYLELKANSASSMLQFQQQEHEQPARLESKHSERAESEMGENDDDFGFEFAEEPELIDFQPREQTPRVNISQQPPSRARAPQKAQRTTQSRFRVGSSSVASSESDGLALLEAELKRDVYSVPPLQAQTSQEREVPLHTRKRRRSFASTRSAFTVGSETASDGLAELEAELNASVLGPKVGGDQRSVAKNTPMSDSDSETYSGNSDSEFVEESDDGLAELEAELEAEVGAAKEKAPAKPKAKKQPPARKQSSEPRQAKASAGKRRRLQDTTSIATESDDGLAALQAELSMAVEASEPPATTARATRASRSSVAQGVEPAAAFLPGIASRRALSVAAALGKPPTGKTKGKAKAVVTKKPVASKAKSLSSKRQKREPTAQSPPQATGSVAVSTSKPAAVATRATKRQAASKISSVSVASTSDVDESDDGLGELEAELQASIS